MAQKLPGNPPEKQGDLSREHLQEFEDWLNSLKPPPPSWRNNKDNWSQEPYDIKHSNFDLGEMHDALNEALGQGTTHHPEESPVPRHMLHEDSPHFDMDPEEASNDLSDVIEQAYGMEPYSGLVNNKALIMPAARKGLINTPLPPGLLHGLLSGQTPVKLPGGPLINIPRTGVPTGPLINTGLSGLTLGGALINKPPAGMSVQDLLKLKALAQLQAGGTHIAAQKVA